MTYTWRRNSEEIEGGGDVPVDGPNLTVRHISRENEGDYTCQAVEDGLVSDWSHGHVLDVLCSVSVPPGPDHVVTHVGHNAIISLNVSQAGGEFKVGVEVDNVTEYLFVKFNDTDIERVNSSRTWYRDRNRVRGNITSSVFRLTLYNVTTEDAGIYECRKTDINQRPPGCEQLLIVAQNPSQPNITGPASAVSGGSVTLTCSSSSRSLPPDHPPLTMTYTWRRNSEEIQGGGDVAVDGPNLTMRDIIREKEGDYTCQAVEEGLVSDWSHGHVLDVLYGPHTVQFNGTDDKVTATEGDPLTVRCSADCNPACTVTWWDTSRQRVTSGQRGAVLYIPAVNRSLSDLYTCHVNNTHGNKSRKLKLDIQSAEAGVSNVVSTAAVCSVLVVLVAVVLAILLYRHKAKKGKRPYRVGAENEDQLQQDPSPIRNAGVVTYRHDVEPDGSYEDIQDGHETRSTSDYAEINNENYERLQREQFHIYTSLHPSAASTEDDSTRCSLM